MYIERTIFKTLLGHRNNKKITILVGARQVGKTTLLNQLHTVLKADHACLFLDLDLYADYEKAGTYENLINTLRLHGYREDQQPPFFLFLDEFQRYADVAMVMKNIADHHSNIKIYASGSSSLGINSKIQESLSGRKRIVHIYPLSFEESLRFQGQTALIDQIKNLANVRSDAIGKLIPELYRHLEAFLIFGGYPEIVLAKSEERREAFDGIFDLYVKKDLVDYLNVEKIKNAKLLIQALAVNNGGETKYSELGQVAGLDHKTVKNYMDIMKETFLISIHTPWHTNPNKEIVKMPKTYFMDNGVRNYFINNFNEITLRADAGHLFEGFVISEMIKKGVLQESIKFWRTKNQMEVDIILDAGGQPVPAEIKYKPKITSKDTRGLQKFRSQYPNAKEAFLINPGNNTHIDDIKLLTPFGLDEFLAPYFKGMGL